MSEKTNDANDFNSELKNALLKKAVGFSTEEITEEYQQDDGEIKLTKKKVTVKNIPPDMLAIKMLLDKDGGAVKNVEEMSDEELESEKERLLTTLKEIQQKKE